MSRRINHEKLNRQKKVNSPLPARPGIKSKFYKMDSKFESTCVSCFQKIKEGSKIKFYPSVRSAIHYNCKELEVE